jgi:hypothetical protein
MSDFLKKKEHGMLLGFIAERQQKLQKKAVKLGQQLCAEKAKIFVSRMHEYWQSWR